MKVAVILHDRLITSWQAEALRANTGHTYLAYNCTNHHSPPRNWKNLAYYLWRLCAIKHSLIKSVGLPPELPITKKVDFKCSYDGIWQELPDELIREVANDRPDLIVKFGMGLLRVPPEKSLTCPIISYHHGDPRRFRGRPAGFYEILSKQPVVGQIVQILSNRLDAGAVVAFAETKVHHHSYRATMVEAYRASPLLLGEAMSNAAAGRILPIEPTGTNYRLPGTATVLKFVMRSFYSFIKRLGYGAFYEKAWQVAQTSQEAPNLKALVTSFPPESMWHNIEKPKGYRFLADPFFHPNGDGVLVEALRNRDGRGEILHIGSRGTQIAATSGGHLSYPSTIDCGSDKFVLPEIVDWSSPRLFKLIDAHLEAVAKLNIEKMPRLIDPTMLLRDGVFFLFGNVASEGSGILRLWHSDGLDEVFREHPSSPIRISPAGARMGGLISEAGGPAIRVGQDFRQLYGDGILLFEIKEISRTNYREIQVGSLRFKNHCGPHTLNISGNSVLFDHYRDRFAVTAGLKRTKARWLNRFN